MASPFRKQIRDYILSFFAWLVFWLAQSSGICSSPAQQNSENAKKADSFVDSMGVNNHPPSYGGIFANVSLVGSSLSALGIRHVRTSARNISSDWPTMMKFYKNYGAKFDLLFTSTISWQKNWGPATTPHTAAWYLQTYAAMVETVEGANETDCHSWNYNGMGFPRGTIAFQTDLYNTIKSSSVTSNIPVLAPSVCSPAKAQPQLYGLKCDYGNMHSYPFSHMPSSGMESGYAYIPNAKTVIETTKPIISTETGYNNAVETTVQWHPAVSEEASGKYLPRMFAEYFNRSIVRTYTYELMDSGTDRAQIEQNFGLVCFDGTPKPAFTAEKNLIALLKEPGVTFTPGALAYSLSGSTSNIHHTLLQKSNGDFYLLAWQEVSTYDTIKKAPVANPDLPITISLTTPINSATVYRFDSLGNQTASSLKIADNTINLSVPDSLLVVKLSPGRP